MVRIFTVLWILLYANIGIAQSEFSSDEIKTVQARLAEEDYKPGDIDGRFVNATAVAIRRYQEDWKIPKTGEITQDLLDRLLGNHPATQPQWFKIEDSDCMIWNETPKAQQRVSWTGGCVNGKVSGSGTLLWLWVWSGATQSGVYEGDLRDGYFHGRGVTYGTDGHYEGEYRNGKRHGRGVYTFADGDRYEGEFRDGEYNGRGVFTLVSGSRYEGEYRDGEPHGRGVYTNANGSRYEGEVRHGKPHGRGVRTYPTGNRYEGEFREGMPNGRGVLTYGIGDRYEGEFRDDKPHGYGTVTHDRVDYSGNWTNGCLSTESKDFNINTTREECGF